ncbi:MAG: nuclease SbcCD subunit D [Candidatus Binatia bacterium]|nr:MAG: nuclease SbcCD subunit D [Candidatus Binatia bacterium]
MRIAHTSDWHAGRIWKNIQRIDELAAVLDHLARFLESEKADLLLVSGDVFDSGAPSAEAERLVFEFLKRTGQAGTRSVVVAGNHDHPARLDAWGTLAELVGVRVVGLPRRAEKGGVIRLTTRSGESATVAALPFAPAHRLVSALELARDETLAKQRYADGFRRMVEALSAEFRADTVNLLVCHTHLEGAVFSGSERQVHLGDEWAAAPQALPHRAHYVALGHIHRPQRVPGAPAHAEYAGSPLQLDFGEEGEAKSFVWIEASPGVPARVERIPYEGGKELETVRTTLEDLPNIADRARADRWLRVVLSLPGRIPDASRRVRELLPNALVVQVELPEEEREETEPVRRDARPDALYREYFRKAHGHEPPAELVEAFASLYEGELSEETS